MRILFADDETSIQELMRIELPRMGHEATVCPDGRTALAALERTAYDCVIVDLDMPGLGGLDVIARVRETSPDTEAVIITGKSSLESAIAAVRQGVFDYLTKPCKLADIQAVLERVRKKRELTARLKALEGRVRRAEGTTHLVGASVGLDAVKRLVARVAPEAAGGPAMEPEEPSEVAALRRLFGVEGSPLVVPRADTMRVATRAEQTELRKRKKEITKHMAEAAGGPPRAMAL
jgi:DNA-binding NtrC family response regulator